MEGESSRALPSWASLLVRSREGDSVAFEELVRGCERRVLAIAYQMTGNLEDAQDVAQESFLRIYRSRDRFQDGRSFEAWLYRIVVNQGRKSLVRRKRRRTSSLDDMSPDSMVDTQAPTPSDSAVAADLSERLMILLEDLSPRLRAVFVLRDLQDMDTSEIARILACTETTVRRHSADARIRLRQLTERRFPGLIKKKTERSEGDRDSRE